MLSIKFIWLLKFLTVSEKVESALNGSFVFANELDDEKINLFFCGDVGNEAPRYNPRDIFTYYVLPTHFRSCNNTLANYYIQISSYSLVFSSFL